MVNTKRRHGKVSKFTTDRYEQTFRIPHDTNEGIQKIIWEADAYVMQDRSCIDYVEMMMQDNRVKKIWNKNNPYYSSEYSLDPRNAKFTP